MANITNIVDSVIAKVNTHTIEIGAKQDNLVSGTNIKTVGGTSLLGSGDIPQYTPPTDQGANNYLAGDGTYKQVVVPTNVSELTNDTGFITGVSWSEVTSKPSFATVATSGSYNDLSNKPTIPTVPTNVSSFTNDAGYVTSSGNTIIGTDADINTSGSTIIDNLYMTDGVITSHGTRTLTLGDLGYTGETNATADQSASEILTAIKTVDGSGSGLDADTVDGLQASQFLRSDASGSINGDLTVNGGDIVLGGTGRIQGVDTVSSSTDAANKAYVDNAIGNIEGVPAGVILMWSGSVSSIPTGWYLCNGANGTPNLTDRFVYGASSDGEVNATGGSANAVVVSHSHSGSAADAGSHTHSGSTNTAGNHQHSIPGWSHSSYGSASANWTRGPGAAKSDAGSRVYYPSGYTGDHSHTVTINSDGSHSHSVTVNASGESGTNKNLPPYMKLAYIMKG